MTSKKIFLIDGLGAILSAGLLSIVLVHFNTMIGLSPSTLKFLAIWPCLFVLYDFFCFFKIHETAVKPYLKGIAYLNLSYGLLSVSILIYHAQSLTALGWIYFILELIVVLLLAGIEIRVAQKNMQ